MKKKIHWLVASRSSKKVITWHGKRKIIRLISKEVTETSFRGGGGGIPGAFEKAFGFNSLMQKDLELNTEEDNLHEGSVKVCFSKEDKSRMRAPW